jgi:hypothetical protein
MPRITRARAAQVAEELHIDQEGVSLELSHDNHISIDKNLAETRSPLGEITGNSISIANHSDDKSTKTSKSRAKKSPNAGKPAAETTVDQGDEHSREAYKIMSESLHAPKSSMRKRTVDDMTKQYSECEYNMLCRHGQQLLEVT